MSPNIKRILLNQFHISNILVYKKKKKIANTLRVLNPHNG